MKPDVVHFDLLTLAKLTDLVPQGIPIVLNEHNIESDLLYQKFKLLDKPLFKLIYYREYKTVLKFEQNICKKMSLVLSCSDSDTNKLKQFGADNVFTIPNGVNTHLLLPNTIPVLNNRLVFVGGMGWYPNRFGIIWFIDKVLPLIVNEYPDIQLDIVGNPEPLVEIPSQYTKNINVLGFVDDFKPIVHKATLMIVPLNVGSGTRLKVIEGMSLGKCIVSTSKGAEGIDVTNNENILIANTEYEFFEEICNAIRDNELRERISINARKTAVDTYDWNVIGTKLISIYNDLL